MDHHAEMLERWRWRDAVTIALGVWLVASPAVLGHADEPLAWSDRASGALIAALGALTLWPRFDLARWAICATGLWLLFAPLVFWTRTAAAYNNDTLAGALAITFSVLVPMMPGRAHHEVMSRPGPHTPPGWSYNPSDWIQRGTIIAMALIGFFISRYLASYQLGHIASPWDPFFGDGTRRVLDSDISKALPISDAGLGAISYLLEALSGFMGGTHRWRTMPWMVLMFGVLVVPLGIVSIVLVILQPVAVGAWCGLCLITAVVMLVMIAPALDEVVAMGQFLAAARRQGQPVWRTFWVGGALTGVAAPEPPATRSAVQRIAEAMDLDNVPWNLALAAAVGIWLMAAPAILGTTGAAAASDQITGALAVTWAVVSFGEIARPARLVNVLLGLWLLAAAAGLPSDVVASRGSDLAAGALLIALSIRRGPVHQRFAGWNAYLI